MLNQENQKSLPPIATRKPSAIEVERMANQMERERPLTKVLADHHRRLIAANPNLISRPVK